MDSATKEKLAASGIDYDGGIDRFGGNEAMFEKFIRRFSNDSHLKSLHQALSAKDAEKAYYHAHSLKGVVGNLSFKEYFNAITPVADLLRENKVDEAEKRMGQVEEAHSKVVQVLEDL